jgi:N-acetylmuramic acid 6-phosphate etherase
VALPSSGKHGSPPAGPPRLDDPGSDTLSLDDLATEAGGEPLADYDLRSTLELVELMRRADEAVHPAIAGAADEIAATIDAVTVRLEGSGRLIYVGAGSSGRIAALDAAECQSTFSTPAGQVIALVAGGMEAAPPVQEAAEDDYDAGAAGILALGVGASDAVVGVSASGRTPYVAGAIRASREAGAMTACIVSVGDSELGRDVDHEIAVVVGPEFLAGSTRLKAGTAQKLVLNMISTISMIRLGKTFGNLMVDVLATNEKLRARVRRIVLAATAATADEVDDALEASRGSAKVAIVSLLANVEAEEARSRLAASGDSIRRALDSSPGP